MFLVAVAPSLYNYLSPHSISSVPLGSSSPPSLSQDLLKQQPKASAVSLNLCGASMRQGQATLCLWMQAAQQQLVIKGVKRKKEQPGALTKEEDKGHSMQFHLTEQESIISLQFNKS